ncbi:LysR family transcriptional regulator, partial [Vibrio breoganii]
MGLSKELKQADLNLLVTLHLLMKYRSVKLVAEEMCLSQSAVSRALGRLRETFSDPLFIRHHAGLEPTDKARMIEVQLSSIINEVDDLLADSPFDLASCNEDFVISAPSLIGCYLIPSLVVQLIKFAP